MMVKLKGFLLRMAAAWLLGALRWPDGDCRFADITMPATNGKKHSSR
ncbi:MAG: hypothetical protein WA885_19090 [Phormidesmis sp.]